MGMYMSYSSALKEYLNPAIRYLSAFVFLFAYFTLCGTIRNRQIVEVGIVNKFQRKYSHSMEYKDKDMEVIEFDFLLYPVGFASVAMAAAGVVFMVEMAHHKNFSKELLAKSLERNSLLSHQCG